MRLSIAFLAVASARAIAQSPVWSRIGPEGGPVSSVAAAPGDPRVVYAATVFSELFRSADGGSTWEAASPIPDSLGAPLLAVDAGDPSTVYAVSRYGSSLARSTDRGEQWTLLEPTPSFAARVTADPNQAGVIYAYGSGVSRSDDGGETWHPRNDGFGCPAPDDLPEILALAVAPSDSSIVYAGSAADSTCRDQGTSATFYRSTDGAAHWIATAFPEGTELVNQIAVAPSNPDSLLAATGMGLFRSTDAGATWTSAAELAGADVTAVVWSVTDPSRAFASASRIDARGETVGTFYRSLDGGATWGAIATPRDVVSSIVSTPPSVVLAGLERNGIYRSTDDGDSWTVSHSGIRAVPVDSIAVASGRSSRVWAGTTDGRVFRSDDAGGSWTLTALDAAGNVEVVPDPARSSVVYAAVTSYENGPQVPLGRVFKSDDAGAHWTEVDDGLGGLPVGLAVDPSNSSTVYASGGFVHTGTGAFKSLDGGRTWKRLDTGAIALVPYDGFGTIAIDPRDPLRLFMGSGAGIDRSEDGGETWSVVDPGAFGALLVLGDASSAVLLASEDGVWKSVDHGDHWFLSGRGVIATSLSESPGRGHAVYASGRPGNAYQSPDAGATWSALGLNGIPGNLGADIVSNGTRLFAATYGGIYGAPVPSLVAPVAAPPKPALVGGR